MLNKAILMGRLTRDPELKHTQSNIPVVTLLAVDRGFGRNQETQQQTTDFINIVAWRNTAEFVSKYFRKGQLVAVSGRIQVRNWKDRDDNNRVSVEVVADECYFAEPKRSDYSASPDSGGRGYEFRLNAEVRSEFEELIGDDELRFKGGGL